MADVNGPRDFFPALGNRQGKRQVYFDNAGGSQTLGAVIDSISDYLSNTNVQLGGSSAASQASTDKYRAGFEAAARFINCAPDQVVFGSSTTQLLRNLSCTLNFQPGDEIVVSAVDHEANIGPWLHLADRQGLVVKWWRPADGKGCLHLDVKKLLTHKTRLVAVTHASNILGRERPPAVSFPAQLTGGRHRQRRCVGVPRCTRRGCSRVR
jgi:selenocysteine lyase/cysteine desulfurase